MVVLNDFSERRPRTSLINKYTSEYQQEQMHRLKTKRLMFWIGLICKAIVMSLLSNNTSQALETLLWVSLIVKSEAVGLAINSRVFSRRSKLAVIQTKMVTTACHMFFCRRIFVILCFIEWTNICGINSHFHVKVFRIIGTVYF